MANESEKAFLDYLSKTAEQTETDEGKRTNVGTTNVYPDPVDAPPHLTEPVHFSDVAQASSKDVRSGVPDRVLSSKPSASAAEKALLSNILPRRDFETSSIELKPVEKVSSRTPTLMEQTRSLLSRV